MKLTLKTKDTANTKKTKKKRTPNQKGKISGQRLLIIDQIPKGSVIAQTFIHIYCPERVKASSFYC